MKTKKTTGILLLLFAVSCMYGQVIKSDKVYLKIESEAEEEAKTEEEARAEPDLIKPEIRIFSPALDNRSMFETSEPEIPILGVATDNNQIESFVFNSEFMELNESGQFTRRVKLFPGENTIIIGALDGHQNYTEKRFIVNYLPIAVSLAEKAQKEAKYYAL
ncbi:MAG: hypothetical protein KAT15_03360, partial [Bacteroidales bacterium]|nr:hypothetical protein [Bacteroidales bacterium]